MKKKMLSMLLALTVTASLVGCATTGGTETAAPAADAPAETEAAASEAPADEAAPVAEGDTIKIGVSAPITGGLALYGESAVNSVTMAVDAINANGGVLGKQLEVAEFVDDKADSTEAVNAYNRLVSDGVVAVIGTYTSSCSIPMAERAQEEGMLLLSPCATNAKLTQIGPNIFRACFIDPVQGPMMAKFAKEEIGATKAAIIFAKDDDYSNGLHESLTEAWSGYGLDVVYDGSCSIKDVDYSAQVSQVVASGADVLFYPCMLDTVPILVQQAREAGFEGAIVGGDAWDCSDTSGKEEYFNNTYYTNHYAPEDPAEAVQNYVAAYKEAYGADTLTAAGACYYDSVKMVAQAIEAAGSAETSAIIDAMTGMTYEGVTGSFTLDENGDPKKPITFVEFRDGAPVWKSNVMPE